MKDILIITEKYTGVHVDVINAWKGGWIVSIPNESVTGDLSST